jgi:hypothetical protein
VEDETPQILDNINQLVNEREDFEIKLTQMKELRGEIFIFFVNNLNNFFLVQNKQLNLSRNITNTIWFKNNSMI